MWRSAIQLVVYLSIPTSNHNDEPLCSLRGFVVYLSIPTSNHNRFCWAEVGKLVVYLSIPTSNHNIYHKANYLKVLFICLFLHQTTT